MTALSHRSCVSPILQKRNGCPEKMKYFAKACTSSKGQSKDWNQGSLPSKPILLILHQTSFLLPVTQSGRLKNHAKTNRSDEGESDSPVKPRDNHHQN